MVNQCANKLCGKPLHYLREGRIFVFDVPFSDAPEASSKTRLQHFWLCGPCSETLAMEQSSSLEVHVVSRKGETGLKAVRPKVRGSLAS